MKPLALRYTGAGHFEATAPYVEAGYEQGRVYRMAPVDDRSSASHRHYFAAIASAWSNLPDELAGEFPSPEHLRKYALIKAGFADRRSIVTASRAEAMRVAAFVQPLDEFALVATDAATVTVWTAHSQSVRAMGKAEFQRSKEAVLDIVSAMIGTDAATLIGNAEAAA